MRRFRFGRARPCRYTPRWTRAVSSSAKQRSVPDATDCLLRRADCLGIEQLRQAHPNHRATAARPAAADSPTHAALRPAGADAPATRAANRTSSVSVTRRAGADPSPGYQARALERDRRASFRQPRRHARQHGQLPPQRAQLEQRAGLPPRHRQRREHRGRQGLRRVALETANLRCTLQEQERALLRHLATEQLLQHPWDRHLPDRQLRERPADAAAIGRPATAHGVSLFKDRD